MNLEISQKAFLEINDANEYYNLQQDGLGDAFCIDVHIVFFMHLEMIQ